MHFFERVNILCQSFLMLSTFLKSMWSKFAENIFKNKAELIDILLKSRYNRQDRVCEKLTDHEGSEVFK